MNVSLTEKQEEYIKRQIASGDYQNASELVRDALRMHQHYREKLLAELKADIMEGRNSPQLEDAPSKIIQDIVDKKGNIS
jgi:antitoxin ParD1/3/4